ncbi:MAG: enoyl-[acyl-carrier-protein] reductase FabK [Syntrophomonadaceae bacterium]|nr:enoyl-[acyl-carrier-protein] reductase FabK [Syntrophomonadaceae bacterium]
MFRTRVCDILDIEYPILQGAMAWIAGGKLAAAVSQAGGLGVIGTGNADAGWLKQEIDIARKITDRVFAVNLMLASPHVQEVAELIVQEKISVVTTGGGNPGIYMEKFKSENVKVVPVVASLALARRLARLGADAMIVEGMESGGHVGEMSTMCLVPMVADAIDIPVIAAGGIADGRGLMAALALGAEGVQVGTRFVCAEECGVHPAYQEKIIKARDRATVVCGISTGHPVRAIHNKFTRQYLLAEAQGLSQGDLEQLGRGKYPAAAVEGDVEFGSVLAGQISGLVGNIQKAEEIVMDIIQGAARIKEQWRGF